MITKKLQPNNIKFNESPVDEIFLTGEKKLHYIKKDNHSKKVYNNFFDQFSTYLSKLPNNYVKKTVQDVYNRNLIYIGITPDKSSNLIFSRIVINSNKLTAIVLNHEILDIALESGDTNSIDECIYAVYFSLIRASILLNQSSIKQNKDLHKLLSTYIYLILVKSLGKNILLNKKQKEFIQLVCIYIYYLHFLKEKPSYIFSILKKDYKEITNPDTLSEFVEIMKNNKTYTTVKDIPKILIDLKVYSENPTLLTINLLKILGPLGYYSFTGPLDQFIGSMILRKYPTELLSKSGLVNEKIHDEVEKIINKYIDKINYDISGLH